MIRKMALAFAIGAAALLTSLPASAGPIGAAGKAVADAHSGNSAVEQVHRRWHRRHHHRHHYYGYYSYRPYYIPYYYRPYRYYYPSYSYYGYPYGHRHHRHRGVSVYLNF